MGLGIGYWVIYLTAAAEQFGTNLRGTVTTTVPEFRAGHRRAHHLRLPEPGALDGAGPQRRRRGAAVLAVSMACLAGMQETFGRDLEFVEAR